MKKISLFLTAALLIVAASCINQELNSDEAQPLKLNITIAGLGGPDTKAAKTAWAEGDKLNCWFDKNDVNHPDPDLVITYTSEGWKAGSLRDEITLNETGYFSIVYESTNDLSSYSFVKDYAHHVFNPQESTLSRTSTISNQRCYCRPLITTAQFIQYTFNNNTLTATIRSSDWSVESKFKVLIKNLPQSNLSAKDYVLEVDNTSKPWTASAGGGFDLFNASYNNRLSPEFGTVSGNNFGMAGGIQEDDGIAFYYNFLWCYDPSENPTASTISITLYEGTTAKKSFLKENVLFNPQLTYCYGVSIDYAKFK